MANDRQTALALIAALSNNEKTSTWVDAIATALAEARIEGMRECERIAGLALVGGNLVRPHGDWIAEQISLRIAELAKG